MGIFPRSHIGRIHDGLDGGLSIEPQWAYDPATMGIFNFMINKGGHFNLLPLLIVINSCTLLEADSVTTSVKAF